MNRPTPMDKIFAYFLSINVIIALTYLAIQWFNLGGLR